jgi:DNA-binding transcriptional MerR regulator
MRRALGTGRGGEDKQTGQDRADMHGATLDLARGLRIDAHVNVNYPDIMSTEPAATETSAAPQGASGRPASFTIADLAREFGVTTRTIRFYEDEGLIKPRRHGLCRIYSAGDQARLGWILRGKRLGFSLAEIRELLALYEVDRSGVQQMRAILAKSREHIADLERKLRDLQAQLGEFREVEAGVRAALAKKGEI